MGLRRRVWERLAGAWKVDLTALTREVTLAELDGVISEILEGRTQGRILVRVGG